jgi:hypothetical protein
MSDMSLPYIIDFPRAREAVIQLSVRSDMLLAPATFRTRLRGLQNAPFRDAAFVHIQRLAGFCGLKSRATLTE